MSKNVNINRKEYFAIRKDIKSESQSDRLLDDSKNYQHSSVLSTLYLHLNQFILNFIRDSLSVSCLFIILFPSLLEINPCNISDLIVSAYPSYSTCNPKNISITDLVDNMNIRTHV